MRQRHKSIAVRYRAELDLLEAARAEPRGISYDAGNANAAKNMVSRCNKLRVEMRDADPEGMCPYDIFQLVIRKERFVVIRPRPTIDTSRIAPLALELEEDC